MTTGHQHHHIHVKSDGPLVQVLRRPLFRTEDLARVEASPYPYGVILNGRRLGQEQIAETPQSGEVYVLTLLGILHRWTGLTLLVKKDQT